MANLDCLIRVSRVGGRAGDSFQSPTAQREACDRDAANSGHTIIGYYEELDVSGGARKRPGLEQIIRRIEDGESQGVIVARIDRFSRTLPGALAAIERIEAAGGEIISVAEKFDTTTAVGRAVIRILLVMAELFRDQATEAFRESRQRAIDRGVHITARVPFGYKRNEWRGSGLEVDENDGPTVTEIYRRRAAGEAYADIARWLNNEGERTSVGGLFTGRNVAQLVTNRVYLGEARSGAIVNASAHEPLVDRIIWEKAQPTASKTVSRERKSMLAGIIRCAGCRRALTGGGSKAYFCHVQHASGRCPEPSSIRQHLADPWVEQQFLAHLGDLESAFATATSELDELQRRVDQAEAELVAWRDTVSVLAVGADTYGKGLQAREVALDDAREAFREAAAASPRGGLPDAETLAAMWPSLSVAERREILAGAIDVVFLRGGRGAVGDRLHICWKGEGPRDLPRPARISPLVPFRFPEAQEPGVRVAARENAS